MIIFFDIETVSIFSQKERKEKYFLELKEKYQEKLSFMPEFNRIITIVVGFQFQDQTQLKSLEGSEEEQIKQFFEFSKVQKLSGYNIKGFDIPFIVKRAVRLGIPIPSQLKAFNKKPWDFDNIIDLYDIWKHIGYSACSLDVLCNYLGITSPKDGGIDGSQVQDFYDSGRLGEIVEYCKRDVGATIKVYNHLRKVNMI